MILLKLLFLASSLWAGPRTVMVQMFEWPWNDLARECETVLGPQGFSAVQVSPPQEHLVLGNHYWWERYQPVSYELESRAGTAAEFKAMIQRCQAAGVDVYVDVVLNHMAGIADGIGFNGTRYTKYNHTGLYSRNDFHFCGKNGNNQIVNFKDRYEVQFCELLGLADLRTESEYVRDTLADYLNRLLDLGVSGFRVDAAKHMPADDVQAVLARLKRSAYVVSETLIGADEPVSVFEYMPFGDVNYFQYSFDLGNAMHSGRIARLPQQISGYPDSRKVVVFVENHDLQRMDSHHIPTYQKDKKQYWLANVFLVTWPYGYPQVFSGYSFRTYDEGPPVDGRGLTLPVLDENGDCRAPWNCEHRMPGMNALVQFRNETDSSFFASKIWRDGDDRLAFSRGRRGFVALNRRNETMSTFVPTDLPDGSYCNILEAGYRPAARNCPVGVQVRNGLVEVKLRPMSALALLLSIRPEAAR